MTDLQGIITEYQNRLRAVREQISKLAQAEQQLIGAIAAMEELQKALNNEDGNPPAVATSTGVPNDTGAK